MTAERLLLAVRLLAMVVPLCFLDRNIIFYIVHVSREIVNLGMRKITDYLQLYVYLEALTPGPMCLIMRTIEKLPLPGRRPGTGLVGVLQPQQAGESSGIFRKEWGP